MTLDELTRRDFLISTAIGALSINDFYIQEKEVVAHWTAEKADKEMQDKSSKKNTCTLTGTKRCDNLFISDSEKASAVYFEDKAFAEVKLSDCLKLEKAFTIEAIMRFDVERPERYIYHCGVGGWIFGITPHVKKENKDPLLWLGNEKPTIISMPLIGYKKEAFIHVGVSWDGNEAKFFYNGQPLGLASTKYDKNLKAGTDKIFIGDGCNPKSICPFYIKELRVHNYAVDQEKLLINEKKK